MRLNEERTYRGHFWIPESPTEKLAGTLTVAIDGACHLELLGIFGDLPTAFRMEVSEIDCLHGVVEGGLITLFGCHYRNRNFGLGASTSKSTLNVELVFKGCHCDADLPDLPRFDITIDGFYEWLGVSAIEASYDWEGRSGSVHLKPPEKRTVRLNEFAMDFLFAWSFPTSGDASEVKITQQSIVSIRPIEPVNFRVAQRVISRITNFFAFAIDTTVGITALTGYVEASTSSGEEGKSRLAPVEIYYPSIPSPNVKPKVDKTTMLFCYSEVEQVLATLLDGWMARYDELLPAFNLYFASKSGAYRYLEGRFLALVQGIETLHRRTTAGVALPVGDFESMREEILSSCPSEHKEWLSARLKYANEPPLRVRLKELLAPFADTFGNSKSRSKFISKVSDTRNYLTHYDHSLADSAARGVDIHFLCEKLEALYQLNLLRIIGMEHERILELAARNRAFLRKIASN